MTVTAAYTSPSAQQSWNVPLGAARAEAAAEAESSNKTQMQQLTEGLKAMQDNLNQYLTQRMAADHEPITDLAQDEEEQAEEQDEEDEDTGADALQRRPEAAPLSNSKKQKTN